LTYRYLRRSDTSAEFANRLTAKALTPENQATPALE